MINSASNGCFWRHCSIASKIKYLKNVFISVFVDGLKMQSFCAHIYFSSSFLSHEMPRKAKPEEAKGLSVNRLLLFLLIPEVQRLLWSTPSARRRHRPPPIHSPPKPLTDSLCLSRRHPPNSRARAPAAKAMATAPRRSRSCTTGCRSG